MNADIKLNPDLAAIAPELPDALAVDGLPADAKVFFRGRNIVAKTADGVLCIKQFRTPGVLKGAIYGFMRKPKALRAFENAVRLRQLGLPTPEPFACVLCRENGLLRESYYVCRYLPGWTELRSVQNRPDFKAIARGLAAFTLELHRKGVFVKDYSMGNVLFRPKPDGGYEFTLVDINRMLFDVNDRDILMLNFRGVLETADATAVLAREYASVAALHDADAFVAEALAIFNRHQKKVERKKQIKKLLKRKK